MTNSCGITILYRYIRCDIVTVCYAFPPAYNLYLPIFDVLRHSSDDEICTSFTVGFKEIEHQGTCSILHQNFCH